MSKPKIKPFLLQRNHLSQSIDQIRNEVVCNKLKQGEYCIVVSTIPYLPNLLLNPKFLYKVYFDVLSFNQKIKKAIKPIAPDTDIEIEIWPFD